MTHCLVTTDGVGATTAGNRAVGVGGVGLRDWMARMRVGREGLEDLVSQ
jgi:hypothetical protein